MRPHVDGVGAHTKDAEVAGYLEDLEVSVLSTQAEAQKLQNSLSAWPSPRTPGRI